MGKSKIFPKHLISRPLVLKELLVVLDVVHQREDQVKVAPPTLFLFEVNDHLQIVF